MEEDCGGEGVAVLYGRKSSSLEIPSFIEIQQIDSLLKPCNTITYGQRMPTYEKYIQYAGIR